MRILAILSAAVLTLAACAADVPDPATTPIIPLEDERNQDEGGENIAPSPLIIVQ